MKKVISALTVAAMCASMAASTMSAFAVYKQGDVSTYLKVVDADKGTISADGKTITFASAKDAAGAELRVAQYLVCDAANPSVQQIAALYTTNTTDIKLNKGYTDKPIGDAVEYTVNGKTFTTDLFVNCFSYLNKLKKFQLGATSYTWQTNSEWEGDGWVGNGDNDVLMLQWISDFKNNAFADYQETSHFFDETKSDSLPFSNFGVTLGSDIKDGTYTVEFLKEYTHPTYGVKNGNWINVDGVNQIQLTDATGITIVVGDGEAQTDPKPTDPKPTDPEPTDPKPTDPEPTEDTKPVDPNPSTGNKDDLKEFTWYVEDVVVDPADLGSEDLFIPINVVMGAMDPGTFAFDFNLTIDGKTIPDAGFELIEIEKGDAYPELPNYVPNMENGHVGVSQTDADKAYDLIAKDGSVVATYYVALPASAKEGDVYTLELKDLKVINIKEEIKTPATLSGTLTIGEPKQDETEPETDPTEPKPTDPVTGDYIYGDVDENGVVELRDVVKLNRFLTGLDAELSAKATVQANCFRANKESDADTTANNLDGKDSMEILKSLIGLVTTLPTQG